MASKKKAKAKKKKEETAAEAPARRVHESALVVQDGFAGIHVKVPVKVSPIELIMPDDLDREEWEDAIFSVGQVNSAGNWWLGDALLYGEQHYGELYIQGASDTGIGEERLKAALYVSNRVAPVRRINSPIISWSHHKEVASLPDKDQTKWLELALKNEWSVRDLKEAMRKKGHKNASEKEKDPDEICPCCETNKAKVKVCTSCLKKMNKAA